MSIRETFSNSFAFGSDWWIWKRWCDADFKSAWAGLPCCLPKGFLKREFIGIYLTTFPKSVIWEIEKLWGSSFFSEWSKFNLEFENAAKKNQRKCFVSQIIASELVSLKLSLWRTGYFSSAANVLTRSSKIRYVSKGDFFEHNFVASGKRIW